MKYCSIIVIIFLSAMNISAQSSFSLSGFWPAPLSETTLLGCFEQNPSNFSLLKDWGLVISYGGEFSRRVNSNIYLISLSKRIAEHHLSFRYTPGYQKEFLFQPLDSYAGNDAFVRSFSSGFSYKEIFGFGYSFRFNKAFSSGLNFRYFSQDFSSELFDINIVSEDSLYFSKNSITEKNNFWKGDLGIAFYLMENLFLSISSLNLIIIDEKRISLQNEPYQLRREKEAIAGLTYSPFRQSYINFLYETDKSFQGGLTFTLNPSIKWKLSLGASVIHDDSQSPFIAGVIPAVSVSTGLFSVSVSGIKYFSDREEKFSFTGFKNSGIENIINNKYSYDKIFLTIGFTLNTAAERLVKFGNVEILQDIYPTFTDDYLETPFASAEVINLSESPVNVKPSSFIEGINNERIHSPSAVIPADGTGKVYFYTIIPDSVNRAKTGISYADFYLTTVNEIPDDEFQMPVLINSRNSWNGKVINLRYFIKNDYDYSMSYAKEILSSHKNILDTLNEMLAPFTKAKMIFESFAEKIVYTSDPRASSEYVQFPNETIKLKGGDCDDLAVLYSSFLESIGIQTAIVDYKNENGAGHVNVLVNTGLAPEKASAITGNDRKYLLRKNNLGADEIWIPVETTVLSGFDSAWETGSAKFFNDAIQNMGIAKGNIEIIDVY